MEVQASQKAEFWFNMRKVTSSEELYYLNVNVEIDLKAKDGEWEGCC